MSEAHAPHWQADPLLQRGPARVPSFVRMPWDGQAAQAFGPWRLHDKADPTQNQTMPSPGFGTAGADSQDPSNAHGPDTPGPQVALPPSEDQPHTANDADARQLPSDPALDSTAGSFSEQQLQLAQQQGYEQGLQEGMHKAALALEAERQKEREALRSLMIELRALEQHPQRFFEPLRKLALHVAEQLVRGELSVSGQAIDRLVKNCLDDLGQPEAAVVVTLNPEDKQRLQSLLQESKAQMHIETDPKLLPGSVRVRAQDAEIQDFIEQRLDTLARRLLSEPDAWLNNAATLNKPTVESLPESTPKRSWFNRAQEIEDTPVKASADASPSAEAEDAWTQTEATRPDLDTASTASESDAAAPAEEDKPAEPSGDAP